jgi:hypothetical protein
MNKKLMSNSPVLSSKAKIAILGGGVAGSTIALRFAELGLDTTIIEKGSSLVNGPPICHLHAGGNLYREICDQQCLTLLQQSIDTVKVYPHSVNPRPTVIALPKFDKREPADLLPRLQKIKEKYSQLVNQDASNKVLGEPSDYFEFFSRSQLETLKSSDIPERAEKNSDWLVAFAQYVDLDSIKYPICLVQEYGLSAFRFAAITSLAIEGLPSCHLQTSQQVIDVVADENGSGWQVASKQQSAQTVETCHYDYVINACGFKSGEIDDMVHAKRQRMVEFKAAYVAHWPHCKGLWPEVIFHGERGTPQGMAQLTPYPGGYFQLHGMTQNITLFEKGLVASGKDSAQPKLAPQFIEKIDKQWPAQDVSSRTSGSIAHLAQFIPSFDSAEEACKPMFGAQQIPGQDADLRAADVSFFGKQYARTEIVKASSALAAADAILANLVDCQLISGDELGKYVTEHYFPVSQQPSENEVTSRAMLLAQQRDYPSALARTFRATG